MPSGTTYATPGGISGEDQEALLEFLYMMPIGVIRFLADGTVDLLNPMAAQLVMPLLPNVRLGNIYTALRDICPELQPAIAAFVAATGTVLDQRRIERRVGTSCVTLALTVSRVRSNIYMAVLKDISRLTDMVAFAFAASDLLLELDAEGIVRWAGGAFPTLLGISPREALGRPLGDLIVPRDRARIAAGLAVMGMRGRLSPLAAHLANPAESPCQISGLMLEGEGTRFMLTIGPPAEQNVLAGGELCSDSHFQSELSNWVRSGQDGTLGLLDVDGWHEAVGQLDGVKLDCLRREIGRLTGGGQSGAVMAEIGDGRFGLLGRSDVDLKRLSAALEDLVGSFTEGPKPRVQETQIDLDGGTLPVGQTLQALRLVLARFGDRSGVNYTTGLAGGLAGIIEQASSQKRALAQAIAAERVALVYQPIVDLLERKVHHYEALLRPLQGQDGLPTNPQEFVTLAETVGLSCELDLGVLRLALQASRQTGASIAVNVSGRSIVDPTFVRRFLDNVGAGSADRLLVEVTETAEIQDMKSARIGIDTLRAAGVQVCLDDFGEGGASFRYLRDLHVDIVKIDGSYVRAAARSEQGQSFVRAMCDLSRSASAVTVAEMIETEADAALMRQLGVQFGQGWLFGRPGPIGSADSAGGSAGQEAAPPARLERSAVGGEYADRFRVSAGRTPKL